MTSKIFKVSIKTKQFGKSDTKCKEYQLKLTIWEKNSFTTY